MKKIFGINILILALSLIAIVIFWFVDPTLPITSEEIVVILMIFTVVVLTFKKLWGLIKARKKK